MRTWLLYLLLVNTTYLSYGQDGFIPGLLKLAYWQVGRQPTTVIVLHGGPGAIHQYLRPEFDALTKTAKSVQFDGASEYLALFLTVRLQTVRDAGHDPWLRDPNLFFSISNDFIRDITDKPWLRQPANVLGDGIAVRTAL